MAMTNRKAYLILQTLLCVLLTALLISTVLNIYRDGQIRKAEHPLEWIYTREIIAEQAKPVAPLFFISLGLGLAGLILDVKDENAEKPVKDAELERDFLVARVAEPSDAMKKERALQKKLQMGGWIAFAVCTVPILAYLANGDHFPDGELEPMIAALSVHVLPWMALSVACLMISTLLQEKSILREIEAARVRQTEEKNVGIRAEVRQETIQHRNGAIQVLLILAAIVLIAVGVMNGSARDVLYKAAKICTECVGLG